MHATTFDTLEFTEQLKAAGVPEEQAKGHAKALVVVMKQTEAHVDELADMRDKESKGRLDNLATKQDLEMVKLELTIRLGLMMAAMFGMFFTALRYFPPTQPIVISNHQPPTLEQGVGKAPEQGVGKTPVAHPPAMP